MRGEGHLPSLQSVVQGLSTAVYGGNQELKFVASLLWETGKAARMAHFRVLLTDISAALDTLSQRVHNEQRRGTELSLWLRKLTEHLATLLCFADDVEADYQLWFALNAHRRGVRVLKNIQSHLSVATSEEINWAIYPQVTTHDVAEMIGQRSNVAARPWFVVDKTWSEMLNGDPTAIERWREPTMTRILAQASSLATPSEIAVLGVYQLNYGLYSTQIHAGVASLLEPWELMYDELLLVVAALLAARVAGLLLSHERDADDALDKIINDVSGLFRLGSPPKPGDKVWLLGDRALEIDVAEVSPDGLVARVRHDEALGNTEVRPCAALVGRHK
jgi:hypothetical protein